MYSSALPHTTILVNEWLPKDLTNIVLGYFQSTKRDLQSISRAGEYETCLQVSRDSDVDNVLYGACSGGHMELIDFAISKGTNYWDHGLLGAIDGNQLEIIENMISRGANDWCGALSEACRKENPVLVRLMISHGAIYCYECYFPSEHHRYV